MGGKFKIKPQIPSSTPVGKVAEQVSFGFSELRAYSYTEGSKDGRFFIDFLARLKKLCSVDWNTINVSNRHSFGTEKMSVKKLMPAARQAVPAGMDSLTVLRATGDNHAFLGYREGNIFQIIFIEYQFGDVYRHSH